MWISLEQILFTRGNRFWQTTCTQIKVHSKLCFRTNTSPQIKFICSTFQSKRVCKFMTQHTILFVHNETELFCFFLPSFLIWRCWNCGSNWSVIVSQHWKGARRNIAPSKYAPFHLQLELRVAVDSLQGETHGRNPKIYNLILFVISPCFFLRVCVYVCVCDCVCILSLRCWQRPLFEKVTTRPTHTIAHTLSVAIIPRHRHTNLFTSSNGEQKTEQTQFWMGTADVYQMQMIN